nr:MAG TPA: hypothetical protein [Herelleviridae sp.]
MSGRDDLGRVDIWVYSFTISVEHYWIFRKVSDCSYFRSTTIMFRLIRYFNPNRTTRIPAPCYHRVQTIL